MSASYRVTGMTCQGCANAVTQAIRAAAADSGVKVDLGQGLVTVEGTVAPEVIARAVEDAGFGFAGAVGAR